MKLDYNHFMSLDGVSLGEYVDDVERSDEVLKAPEIVEKLLDKLNSLSLEKSVYALRWSFMLNLPSAFNKAIDLLHEPISDPSAKLAIVRSMRRLPSITCHQRLQLMNISHHVPSKIWSEAVNEITII